MAKAIMVQGTTSNAGKSFLAAGLCRVFRQDGLRVAPFKSQNMALNSFITSEGLEMGRAQVMQAEAAGLEPDVRMNPILLKPTNDTGSQVIVNGISVGNMSAVEYFRYKGGLKATILEAYRSLAEENDVIVLEGAGSPAEINLKQDDIVNMGMARMAKAPVILAGDIDRGGVFASLYGTVKLLTEQEQACVKATVINKFRGDPALLQSGLRMLEDLTHIPVAGVLPYIKVELDDEDSLSERMVNGAPEQIDIAVIRLPRISNFTDFNPFGQIPGVSLRYVSSLAQLGRPDLILLPGTKNTMGDLLWMRQNGLEAAVKKHASSGEAVMGICGGYQMLGAALHDPDHAEGGGDLAGMGLLPMETVFSHQKVRTQTSGKICESAGVFAPMSGCEFTGYEIHMGRTTINRGASPFSVLEQGRKEDGLCAGNVCGTYVHGIFDSPEVSSALVRSLLRKKGLPEEIPDAPDMAVFKEIQYNTLAAALREHLDMKLIYRILEEGIR